MAAICGALLVLSGTGLGFDQLKKINYLDEGITGSRAERAAQVAGKTLALIGSVTLAVGLVIFGATLFSAPYSAAFLPLFKQAIAESLPWLGSGIAAIASGNITYEIAR